MNDNYETCNKLKKHLNKCLKLNIQVFGIERGEVMCEQLQSMYNKYCLNIN